MKQIILAAGCFWSVQYKLSKLLGVAETKALYAGGHRPEADYREVCSGHTGHAEAVHVTYDDAVLSTRQLLEFFFSIHDASQLNRQGPDIGDQYRSAIFYFDEEQQHTAHATIEALSIQPRYQREPIVTQVLLVGLFSEAEEYHQNYYLKKGF